MIGTSEAGRGEQLVTVLLVLSLPRMREMGLSTVSYMSMRIFSLLYTS